MLGFVKDLVLVVSFFVISALIHTILEKNLEIEKLQQQIPTQIVQNVNYVKHVEAQPIKKWKGGKSFDYENIYATVHKVIKDFPKEIRDERGMVTLMLETACIESTFGEIVKQKGGPALGVFQMQPGTFRYLQKSADSKEKAFMDKFKDNKMNGLDNLKYNVEFQVATALVLYSSFGVHEKNLRSKDTRAKLYKKYWNTPKGKATPSLFIKRANQHLSNFYI